MAETKDPTRELRPLSLEAASTVDQLSERNRGVPVAMDSEGMVLSELMVNPNESFDRIQGILSEEHFWSDANRHIFQIIVSLHENRLLIDIPTIAQVAKEKGLYDRIGGSPYLMQIGAATPALGPYLEQHARKIKDMWRRRMVILTAQRVAVEGYGDIGDDQEWVETVEGQFSKLAHEHHPSRIVPVGTVAADEVFRIGDARREGRVLSGVSTGYPKLDHLLSGLHKGDLYIVAGRPGMGKTSFVTSMFMNISRTDLEDDGEPRELLATALFSLEQPKEQIAMRVLCSGSGADFARVRQNHFHNDDYNKMTGFLSNLAKWPLYIDDKPAITIMEMRAQVRKLQRQIQLGIAPVEADRLGAVAVDYIQLMMAEKSVRSRGSREQEVSSISQGLKNLAKELGVPVIALSQLNRGVEMRSDKTPQLSDLRESGAIEQDADTILFLYRESYYDKSRDDNLCDVIVAKQRNGPTDTMQLAFERETTLFRNLTADEDMGGQNLDDEENPYA